MVAAKEKKTDEPVESAEFAPQTVSSDNYRLSTDDHYGVVVLRLGKVGGVNDEFVIPAERLQEVIELFEQLKL